MEHKYYCAWFEASSALYMRTAFFWVIKQGVMEIYDILGQHNCPIILKCAIPVVCMNNRYKGAVNNKTSISNDVYREWKFNYMFRPDTAIIKFTSKGYQKFVTTMLFYKEGEISSSGYNYVIINNLSWGGGFCNLGLCWHRLWCLRRYYSLCGFPCGVSS